MSPRAAARLESLGFKQVYDYAAGKTDWGSAGLPLEGANGSETRAELTSVPMCRCAVSTTGFATCAIGSKTAAGTPVLSSTSAVWSSAAPGGARSAAGGMSRSRTR
jgi:hypothetical protein